MIPPIWPMLEGHPSVLRAFGRPPRVFPFATVEQEPERPYALWSNITGSAQQFLNQLPDCDYFTVQFDVYAGDPKSLILAARALRDALEPHGYVTRWGNQSFEEDTKLYRYSFDFDLIVNR